MIDIYNFYMTILLDSFNLSKDKFVFDKFAEKNMIHAVRHDMSRKQQEARNKGRIGWWDKDVCSIEHLYNLRDKAIQDKDHTSVINFTAMIAMRESVEPVEK